MKMGAYLLTVMLLAGTTAFGTAESADKEDKLQLMIQQQTAIRLDVEDGGIDGLTPRQNAAVRRSLDDFFKAVGSHTRLDELTVEDSMRVHNAAEAITAQVRGTRQAQEAQEVCWRERKLGLNLKVTRCGTQQERDQTREDARAWMHRPEVCIPPGCGAEP
jgi:hypothetical protein